MIIKKEATFTILEDERDDIKDFVKYLSHKIPAAFSNQNILVDLGKYSDLTLDQLLFFMELSDTHRASKRSFVIVNDSLDPDVLPDEIMVVPTLQEGADVVEMEEIERDLGF